MRVILGNIFSCFLTNLIFFSRGFFQLVAPPELPHLGRRRLDRDPVRVLLLRPPPPVPPRPVLKRRQGGGGLGATPALVQGPPPRPGGGVGEGNEGGAVGARRGGEEKRWGKRIWLCLLGIFI